MQCAKCGQHWPDTEAFGAGCPFCLLAFTLRPEEPPPTVDDPPEAPLSHLGPYTIVTLLGRGGMGVVYRARHEGLNRTVALKILNAVSARRKGFPERFQREGQMLAVLNHPNIVRVHDLGCEAGVYYLAMEEVAGATLRQRLRQGRLPWERVQPLFAQLCDALQHAHERGVIHRDVKPENVLIDDHGHLKIADFGVGKLLGDGSDLLLSLTESGALVGTRFYTAPEQLEGSKEVDHRADIYALGVVLYEMLTGELPLGVFPPPSQRSLIDPRLDALVLRALAKEPTQRYASAGEFKDAVLQLAQAKSAPPRQRRAAIGRAAVLASLLLAALVWLFFTMREQQPSVASVRDSRPITEPATPVQPATDRRLLAGHKGKVWAVAFAPDSRSLATACEDRMLRLWSVAEARELHGWAAFPRGELGYLSVAFNPKGETLATAGGESAIRLWDVATRKEVRSLPGHSREVTSLAFAPDGSLLASAGHDRNVKLWDVQTGKLARTLSNNTDAVLGVAFSADGDILAGSAMTGDVRLWQPATGNNLGHCGHARRVWAVAFAPQRTLLATGSHDRTIKLWDLAAPQPFKPQQLEAQSEVWSLAHAPNGRWLASGGHDGVVRLWEVETGRLLKQLPAHQGPVSSVAFSPNGRYLASGSWDQTVILWEMVGLQP